MSDENSPEMDPKAWRQQPAAVRKRLSERWLLLKAARAAAASCPLPEGECVPCSMDVYERLSRYLAAVREAI